MVDDHIALASLVQLDPMCKRLVHEPSTAVLAVTSRVGSVATFGVP